MTTITFPSIESNKLIAEFMNIPLITSEEFVNELKEQRKNGIQYSINKSILEDLTYHSDWNSLMEVIEKIVDICLHLDSMEMYYNITDSIPSIDTTYNACIEFIEWYNENKN